MALLIFAATIAVANADYLQSSIFSTADCSGSAFAKSYSYLGCVSVGGNMWISLSCSSASVGTLNAYTNAQCTGTSNANNPIPIPSTCTAGSPASQSTCVTGAFSPPPGVIITGYTS